MKRLFIFAALLLSAMLTWNLNASDRYTLLDLMGSAKPYPAPDSLLTHPDSLQAVMINHVGRHGARFPASDERAMTLLDILQKAEKAGTITPTGRMLLELTYNVVMYSTGRWGTLDPLGMAEQRGIASRMRETYPQLFDDGTVTAISSYVPRCIMSMYSFTHELASINNHIDISTNSGRVNSPLMRPFDLNKEYVDYRKDGSWKPVYDNYFDSHAPANPIIRAIGTDYPIDRKQAQELSMTEYGLLAGLRAMSIDGHITAFFSIEELNALWACNNLKQYLQRTASSLTTLPASIASKLLDNLITTTDDFIAGRNDSIKVMLRFGHAETMMPLLSLMRLPGCYYVTDDMESVAQHWHNFHVVPMASNLQIIVFRSTSGRYYVRFDLNECPVPLLPDDSRIYIPWDEAKARLKYCLTGQE